MFVPKHGDVCVFRPSELLHCTRRLQGKGLLGLAFFQKCSLYRQLGRLIHPDGPGIIDYKDKNGNVRVVETREGFLEKKRFYERHLLENQFSIKEFMVNLQCYITLLLVYSFWFWCLIFIYFYCFYNF